MHDEVFAIQRLYPQIFLACHTQHARSRSTPLRISAADSSLLAHLDFERSITAGDLAAHMGIGAPAMSASLARLERLGYLERGRKASDRRRSELRLTARGADALQGTSVLDTELLTAVVASLTGDERRQAVLGLELLARASRDVQMQKRKWKPRRTSARTVRKSAGGKHA